MKAIKCEFPNDYGFFLKPIMEALNEKTWTWSIEVSEVYRMVDGNVVNVFESNESISNEQFIQTLADHSHYLVFAEWKAFPDVESIRLVTNFKEFASSDCQFIILVVDTCYVTLIAKDDGLLANIHKALQNNGVSEIQILNETEIQETYYIV